MHARTEYEKFYLIQEECTKYLKYCVSKKQFSKERETSINRHDQEGQGIGCKGKIVSKNTKLNYRAKKM